MQEKRKFLFSLLTLVFLLFCTITEATAQTSSEIAQKALDSLVVLELEVEDRGRKRLIPGSGFFVQQQNWIATCLHVIEGATKGTAKLVETGQEFHIEGIIASDKKHDLAILKVADFGGVPLPLGNSDAIRVGEAIPVAGNPQLSPDYEDAYNNRGTVKVELGFYKSAISHYDKAIELKPDYADAYRERGLAKHKQGAYSAVILDYDRAIELKPDYADAYRERGRVKADQGAYESAILDYDIAIELEPDYADAYND